MISIYNKKSNIEINARRFEQMEKLGSIIQYGRQNPVWFIEEILGCPLMDYQRYMILGGWTAQKAIYVQSRASGKSFIASLIIMAKTILYPAYAAYIMAPTARQANELFNKIRDIAMRNLQTIAGNDVFLGETIKTNGNATGFVTASGDPHVDLYNGSSITALNGSPKGLVSIRSSGNFYDEAGKLNQEFFDLTEPFTAVDSNFRAGVDPLVYPKNIPNQCYYFSSAEDTSTHLWNLYKEGAKRMMMGYRDYFVCDINCEMPLHPTMNGKPFTPLLTQGEIDAALRSNEYKARREYYNLFDLTGGVDNIVSSDTIYRNEKQYLPLTTNPDPKSGKKYIISIDPAHQIDNSFCLIMEAWKDKQKGWMGRVVNGYNMIKLLPNGDKKLYTMPEAVDFIRDVMVRYNGGAPNWENIIMFVDPGSGGGGLMIADFLRQDWTDKYGNTYRGVIDMDDENSSKERFNYPHAVEGILHLYTPQKFKNSMFSALSEMMAQDLIQLPEPCPRGSVAYFESGEVEITSEDRRALVEIDLMKEEIKLIKKMTTDKGNIKYGLAPSVEKKAHDDRVYTISAAAYILSLLRKEDEFGGKQNVMDFSKLYGASAKTLNKINNQKRRSPFAGGSNPFRRR